MNSKEEMLLKIQSAKIPLRQIDELYNNALNLAQQAEAADTRAASARSGRAKIIGIIAGVITAFFSAAFFLTFITEVLGKVFRFFRGFNGVAICIIATVFTVRFVYRFVRGFLESSADQSGHAAAEISPGIQRISDQIEQIAADNADAISAMPKNYRYYEAVQFFETVLENGRADNMKEAINLYEDNLHKLRIENYNRQLIFANEQQSRMLAELVESAEVIEGTINLNLTFDLFRYLSR